jgi:cytochrome c oxidase subunit 2
VKLFMQSQDVMHAFFVPDFRTKADVFPNRFTTTWFKANKPSGDKVHPRTIAEFESAKASAASKGGRYSGAAYIKELEGVPYEDHWLFCAEYCGDEHSEMAAIIRIVPEDAWRRWLDTIGTGSLTPIELGKRVFQVKGCGQCHTVDGGTSTGPTWKGLYGHPVLFTDGTSYTAEQMSDPVFFANYVRESILTPGTKIVQGFGNQMTPFQGNITEREIEAVIAYIESLSDHAPAPAGGEPAKGSSQGNPPAKPTEQPAESPKK